MTSHHSLNQLYAALGKPDRASVHSGKPPAGALSARGSPRIPLRIVRSALAPPAGDQERQERQASRGGRPQQAPSGVRQAPSRARRAAPPVRSGIRGRGRRRWRGWWSDPADRRRCWHRENRRRWGGRCGRWRWSGRGSRHGRGAWRWRWRGCGGRHGRGRRHRRWGWRRRRRGGRARRRELRTGRLGQPPHHPQDQRDTRAVPAESPHGALGSP